MAVRFQEIYESKVRAALVAERDRGGPYPDLGDLVRRVGLNVAQLEALATAAAFDTLGLSRRQAIWEAGNAAQERADYLNGTTISVQPPLLPMLTGPEQLASDLWATGISTDDHPVRFLRAQLRERGVALVGRVADLRQQPGHDQPAPGGSGR